jgi:hypothetical protein
MQIRVSGYDLGELGGTNSSERELGGSIGDFGHKHALVCFSGRTLGFNCFTAFRFSLEIYLRAEVANALLPRPAGAFLK